MTRHGVGLLRAYCADRGLAWDERGKLVVARNEAETVKLRELERRSKVNGVPGVQWLDRAELRELEPEVAGVAALLSPTTAIVDYPAIARSFAADVTAAGGRVLTSTPVTALRLRGAGGADGVEADTPAGSFRLSRLVICAGLQADLLAATVGRHRRARDHPVPGRVPAAAPARGRPGAAAHLPGARPPVPVPRGPPDAPRRRQRPTSGPTRCSRWPARGTGAPT